MMRNTFASRPYTVPPKRLRDSTRIWNGPYPQGPPPTLYTHFQTHPTVGYAPTLVNGWFQPQPAYPNNNYSPNGSYIQPIIELSKLLFTFYASTAKCWISAFNIYSHSIQKVMLYSKTIVRRHEIWKSSQYLNKDNYLNLFIDIQSEIWCLLADIPSKNG
ncbi:hypothetical protein CEXT_649781 [Caerostris extrusa]|uniref:Uncharacterized protein n=1 Tax=Caerostris extrusa TaxID=172846 RepID=A0AAV4T9H5_CAEEX|nr:hypothetical protein CEXT_649781 [Caerostris extrusa]